MLDIIPIQLVFGSLEQRGGHFENRRAKLGVAHRQLINCPLKAIESETLTKRAEATSEAESVGFIYHSDNKLPAPAYTIAAAKVGGVDC